MGSAGRKRSPQGGEVDGGAGFGDAHDLAAAERERLAGEREKVADERERIADERERLADERDTEQDLRESRADQRQAEFDSRGGQPGVSAEAANDHASRVAPPVPDETASARERIARLDERLNVSRARLDRARQRIGWAREHGAEETVQHVQARSVQPASGWGAAFDRAVQSERESIMLHERAAHQQELAASALETRAAQNRDEGRREELLALARTFRARAAAAQRRADMSRQRLHDEGATAE